MFFFQSAKGLEFDTVFIPAADESKVRIGDPTWKMSMYVIMARARTDLRIMYTGDYLPEILKQVPPGLYETVD